MRKAVFLSVVALCAFIVGTGCTAFGGQLGLGTAVPGSIIHNQNRPGYNSVGNGFQLRSEGAFEFVQAVTASTTSSSILGAAAFGEGGFGKLYEEAKNAGGDDVINIRTDVNYNNLLGIYLSAEVKWYGVAIRYKKSS